MLIQNGSHRFLLIVKEAKVGPKKDTTYEVELIYEKFDTLRIVSPSYHHLAFWYFTHRCTYSLVRAEVNVKIVDWNTHSPPRTLKKGPTMIALVGSMREKCPMQPFSLNQRDVVV